MISHFLFNSNRREYAIPSRYCVIEIVSIVLGGAPNAVNRLEPVTEFFGA